MNTDQNVTLAEQQLEAELAELLTDVQRTVQAADSQRLQTREKVSEIETQATQSIQKAEQISGELDQIEKEAEAELDILMMQYADDLNKDV